MRLGLCCTFVREPIRFRTTTVRYASTLEPRARHRFLSEIALHNAGELDRAIGWCARRGVGAFRIQSGMVPLATHREVGHPLKELDRGGDIRAALAGAGARARRDHVRLSFHPDQFVVPGSPNESSVANSIAELEYLAEIAEHVGAAQLTIHGGGRQGGKDAALGRLERGLGRLSPRARGLVALENDDRSYTPLDLLPLCRRAGVPLVYDVHHHRCNPDDLEVAEATDAAAATWGGREPYVHLSSPEGGWGARNPRAHADYVSPKDVPREWLGRRLTVDIEAKAKELAVLRLERWRRRREPRPASGPESGASSPPA